MITKPLGPESGRKVVGTDMLAERFWARVEKTDGCWLWKGYTSPRSHYGYMSVAGMRGPVPAHRVAYALQHGECPPGLVVMHSCDVKACVNPDHLEAGDQTKNMADAAARGRMENAWNPGKCRGCGATIDKGYRCAECLLLTQRSQRMVERGKQIQRRLPTYRDTPEQSWEEVVALVGERRALIYARNHGLYAFPFPEKCSIIAKDHGMSRERVRQIVSTVSHRLGGRGGTFWSNRATTIPYPIAAKRKKGRAVRQPRQEPKEVLRIPKKTQTLAKLIAAGEPNLAIALEMGISERAVRTRINALASLLPGEAPARRRIAEWWVSQDPEAK